MSLRDRIWYPILYMAAITLISSAIIILFGSLTRQRVQDNQLIAFERAVLGALHIGEQELSSPSAIHTAYSTLIRKPDESSAGAFRFIKDDSLIAYALPLEGPGFWAPIKGIIGILADRKTVTGIAFYEQNETPGLGGEIVKSAFTEQFKGKILSDVDPALSIVPVSVVLDEHRVHAVTGATQTSTRLAEFMNETIVAWRNRMKREE
ncbi:MAG: FMN-binding protein [candidate division WOR-3 bacterium]|nr:MAG: FMN-binding protein [candidate division WOR-3 bacterium]